MATPKLTTGRSLRGTTTTSRPLASFQRSILGSASSAALGGEGAAMRSLRFCQYASTGAGLTFGFDPLAFALSSYSTSIEATLPGGLAAGCAHDAKAAASATKAARTW